jgi:hypothetical protein
MIFEPFPKMARLKRECLITEKIDGTNASIFIYDPKLNTEAEEGFTSAIDANGKVWNIKAGSRTRWITPSNDNFGFAQWVWDHADKLIELGEGHHFGEWWGCGIQRAYGCKNGERFFSLFNASRWVEHDQPTYAIEQDNPKAKPKFTEHAPACCKVVPILYEGIFSTLAAKAELEELKILGSKAAPEYMNPEGIVVYHKAAGVGFKVTIEDDDKPKSKVATAN